MKEEILGFVVSFGEGHSVRFPNRSAADAMARFLERRKMPATIYAYLLQRASGETVLRPIGQTSGAA